MAYTDIDRMPYTNHLGGWLDLLDLRGTSRLIEFDLNRGTTRLGRMTFPLLRSVRFNYHAHCCDITRSEYSYFKQNTVFVPGRRAIKRFVGYFVGEDSPSNRIVEDSAGLRLRREIPTVDNSTSIELTTTCISYTELNVDVTDPPTTEVVTDPPTTPPPPDPCDCNSGLYSSSTTCDLCKNNGCESHMFLRCGPYMQVCEPNCATGRRKREALGDDVGGANATDDNTTVPDGWFFHKVYNNLLCTKHPVDDTTVSLITQVYRPCDEYTGASGISPTPSMLVPMPSLTSQAILIEPSATVAMTTPTVTPFGIDEDTVTMATGISPTPSMLVPMPSLTSQAILIEPSTTVAMTTPTVTPVGIDEGTVTMATSMPCSASVIEASCVLTISPTTTPTGPPPEGWFYPNPNNKSFICIPLEDIDTTTSTPLSTTPTTVPPTGTQNPHTMTPQCGTEAFRFNNPNLEQIATTCSPVEDAFNPCEDLLGEDDVLRSFIWIVISLAIIFNSLVITVFIGYSLILKRTKIELFVVHFLYFNLALADFMMGVYLFTIAVQDLRTLNNFAMYDIAWRVNGGCSFAGFCAITSTMVSVYVLVVITIERLYTFSRALRKSRTSKKMGCFLMAVGWGFGITMGTLPLIGVSDYTATAICLPFDVTTGLDQAYVLFLLLFTGISFTVIAVSYVVIFYQVFYRRRATLTSVSDRNRWKTELKVALKMGLLVLTNFVCWFPIALLGISAAVGNSLVDNIVFAKWVMVFIFPINACLNPILYSVLSKVFRDNVVLLLGKCGICKGNVSQIRRRRAGLTPSVISTNSRTQVSGQSNSIVMDARRGTIIENLRHSSITSSTADLLARRSSTMSQMSSEEHYRLELRRNSEYSSASSEDILGMKVNSRRGSAFSGGSIEENTAFSNPNFRSSSPVGDAGSNGSNEVGNHKAPLRAKISLGAVPEEVMESNHSEIPVVPEVHGEIKHNPAYKDFDDGDSGDLGVSCDGKLKFDDTDISDDIRHYTVIDSEKDSGHGDEDSREASVVTDWEGVNYSDATSGNDFAPSTTITESIDKTEQEVTMHFD